MSQKPAYILSFAIVLCTMAGIHSSHHSLSGITTVYAQSGPKATPADGYTVHVTAPHVVNGKVMGPFHHFCKVVSSDPKIVCQIYDSADPNALMTQIEWIYAKKLVRPAVALETWNKNWHDHQVEIATGRVQVLDLPPDKAKEVADLVATTDGLIYSFTMKDGIPTGTMTIPQAVGHKPITAAAYKASAEDKK